MSKQIKIGCIASALSQTTFVSGIQKVTVENNRLIKENLASLGVHFSGVHVEPQDYHNDFRQSEYLASDVVLKGEKVGLADVDLLFIPDCTSQVPAIEILKEKERREFPVVSLLFDVLPLTHPQLFPTKQSNMAFQVNLQKQLAVSDVIVCISETTKRGLLSLGFKIKGEILVSHLGAPPVQAMVPKLHFQHTLICVGTIEPRKGHKDLIDAFDILRVSIPDLVLIIAGRLGWDSELMSRRIMSHPEYKKRLKWFESPSEKELEVLYSLSKLAIAPTVAEGYGLNIDEALSRSVKVLARDLQVFRERESKNVYYFSGGGHDLALAITKYIDLEFETEELRQFRDFSQDVTSVLLRYLPRN